MKKFLKILIVSLLILSQLPINNASAINNEGAGISVFIPSALWTFREVIVDQSNTPNRLYAQERDNHGNLYAGYLDFEKTLAVYSTGKALVRYSGSLPIVGSR
ncbi:MAG: hypothetical protein Q4B23_04075 [Helcococcus sp.]|nr:hypothetical protein [Helcococcus sp.]